MGLFFIVIFSKNVILKNILMMLNKAVLLICRVFGHSWTYYNYFDYMVRICSRCKSVEISKGTNVWHEMNKYD